MSGLLEDVSRSPEVIVHTFDPHLDRALIIRLPAERRRKASFLDDRILGAGVEGAWANWADVEPAARRAPKVDPLFIFHVGHCGSTLVSRLIEEATGARSMREPNGLRTLAVVAADCADGFSPWGEATFRDRLSLYLKVIAAGQKTVIKATSWCGELADFTGGPALFCYSRPDAYIATMLGGANNPVDLKLNAPIRLRRLRRLCGGRQVAALPGLSPGEMAAMSWATETATIAGAMARDEKRFHAIEFDSFLAAPAVGLAAAIAHLGLNADSARIGAALAGPLMRTYSKDASFDYSPNDRRALLEENKSAHSAEIKKGLAWLEALAKKETPIAAALSKFNI